MSQSDSTEETIFEAARRLGDPEKQAAYLDLACGKDQAFRQRIEQLLRAGSRAKHFFREHDATLPLRFPPTAPETTGTEGPGSIIGRYKLLQQIGEGGCGVVYMAEQEEPVRRRVALKVIKLGMDTKQVIARFEAERQALAMMDHPNIAKVLDAGATDTGRPYFVMELVRGIKITDYCDENNLSAEERLDLFIKVCQAIQHAHQKGIIHRDIKPSNILVASNDGVPVPKVIDFGIAKATQGRLTDQTVFTAFEQFIGTPAYMSPEQAALTMLDIDTRTDIYSLGVLLYELLTGKTPLEQNELQAAGLEEMRRTIREKEPARPSTRLSTMAEGERTTTAKNRHTDAAKLIHQLRGDLDWIVMKALEKDRARRYETANGFARDIERSLNNEPVVARPPSKLYRLQKLARRNKLAFAAAAAVAAALITGLAVSIVLLAKERQSRRRAVAAEMQARTEALKSKQYADLLKKTFRGVGPSVARGRDTALLKEILDEAAGSLSKESTNLPEVEVEMCLTLANTYLDLGSYKQMEVITRRSLEVARARLGETNVSVADSLIAHGQGLLKVGQEHLGEMPSRNLEPAEINTRLHDGTLQEAEKDCRQGLAMSRKLLGDENLKVAGALNLLASILLTQSRAPEAETVFLQALAMYQKLLAGEDSRVANLMGGLAIALSYQGDNRLAEAEAWIEKAIAMQRKLFGDNHPDIAKSLLTLAIVQDLQGKHAEAVNTFGQTANMWRTLKADDRVELAFTLNNMAHVLRLQGKLPEAEARQREALQVQRKVFGNKHKDVAISLARLGMILRGRGQLADAETSLREALQIWRELQTPDRPEFADTLQCLGMVLIEEHKPDQAETNLTEAVAMRRRLFGNEHPDVADSLYVLGQAQDSQGKVAEAVTAVREALGIHSKVRTNDSPEVANELNNLGFWLSQADELAEAETTLKRAVAMKRSIYGNVHVEVAKSLYNLATVLRMEGKLAEAETVLRDDLAVEQRLGNENIVITRFVDLDNLLTREGKPAEAESFLNQVLSREPHVSVASHLISQAAMAKQARAPDCPERCSYLLRCAWEILQRVPSEDLAQLPGAALFELMVGGNKQQATNICWKILDSSATDARWFNQAAWYFATTEDPSKRDAALAVELAKRSLKLNDDRGDWNTLGVARYRAGDFKQALADLEKSTQLDHERTSFNCFFMAMAHHQLGDDDAARRVYDQAIKWMKEHGPQNPELLRFWAEAEQLLGMKVQSPTHADRHE